MTELSKIQGAKVQKFSRIFQPFNKKAPRENK